MENSKTAFPYNRSVFKNGLRFLHVPMENTKTIVVTVLVGVGSRYEEERTNGLSHFLEHMCFKGTQKRPNQRAVAQELDAVGAEYNAFTDKELTGYYVKTDTSHAELAVDVVSDIFLNSLIPDAAIEKERGVIIGEIDMYEDMPMRKVGDVFEELLYPNHPVGWDIAGRKEVIRSLVREDFTSYRSKYYRAENTVVIVAGNIPLEKATPLVEKYFSEITSGKTPPPLELKESQSSPAIRVRHKQTDQTHFILGCRAYSVADDRRWPLALASIILGGNMSSRLFLRVRDELGLGYYVRAGASSATDHGYFEVSAGVANDRAEEAIKVILEELVLLKEKGVSAEELKKAYDYAAGSTLIGLESTDELAGFYGSQEVLKQPILTPEERFSILKAITPDEIKAVVGEVLVKERLNLALIGPQKDEDRLRSLLSL